MAAVKGWLPKIDKLTSRKVPAKKRVPIVAICDLADVDATLFSRYINFDKYDIVPGWATIKKIDGAFKHFGV